MIFRFYMMLFGSSAVRLRDSISEVSEGSGAAKLSAITSAAKLSAITSELLASSAQTLFQSVREDQVDEMKINLIAFQAELVKISQKYGIANDAFDRAISIFYRILSTFGLDKDILDEQEYGGYERLQDMESVQSYSDTTEKELVDMESEASEKELVDMESEASETELVDIALETTDIPEFSRQLEFWSDRRKN